LPNDNGQGSCAAVQQGGRPIGWSPNNGVDDEKLTQRDLSRVRAQGQPELDPQPLSKLGHLRSKQASTHFRNYVAASSPALAGTAD
jgi:hypothetical protein